MLSVAEFRHTCQRTGTNSRRASEPPCLPGGTSFPLKSKDHGKLRTTGAPPGPSLLLAQIGVSGMGEMESARF
jgi:hypothetical protein